MIGVIAQECEYAAVREFFELFKTPWELYREEHTYDTVLCASGCQPREDYSCRLVVVYSGRRLTITSTDEVEWPASPRKPRSFLYDRAVMPIFGSCVSFSGGDGVLIDEETKHHAIRSHRCGDLAMVQVGYDLFQEVQVLLTSGQPSAFASSPTLDLHIALLRELIVGNGLPLVEIPPVPSGYRFIACLTHDVDHPLLRAHRFDHTMFGFVYRAVVGSVMRALSRRLTWQDVLVNWWAVLKLPLVHLGLARDFWKSFGRYVQIENGARSSFFIIPFRDVPGRTAEGQAPAARGAQYEAGDLAQQIQDLQASGCEIGLHGIDAWLDSSTGREELAEIERLTGKSGLGVRMHWLYFDERSPAVLEAAGAAYDSTAGYNQTIGYRVGTSQTYKPLNTVFLLELPLHIMDTALFYPEYLNLSDLEAGKMVVPIIEHADSAGGCVTINWHDRSIAPERLWAGFYRYLVQELERREAWFATAGQAVAWFRLRRSAVFARTDGASTAVCASSATVNDQSLPGLRFRVHTSKGSYHDLPLNVAHAG
jgi:hypothetical protein